MSLTRDNDSMQQKFQSIRSIWRSQLNTLREETAAIRTVLKRQYGMSDDLQTGGDTKRLRREHERTMEMQERLDEISSELAATTQQLEEERKLRSAAKDGHKQVQEQLDTIRDMLNPRQRENMKGILTRSRSNAHLDASILSDQSEEDVENEVPRTRSGGKRRTGRSDYRDVRPVLSPLSPTGGNDGHNKNADSFHESFMSPLSPGDYGTVRFFTTHPAACGQHPQRGVEHLLSGRRMNPRVLLCDTKQYKRDHESFTSMKARIW
eukprot:m.456731 g.456731  ORF g.456731 m.456731 type:complete len:265 (-) comp21576_c0_seq1:3152-3946(-)